MSAQSVNLEEYGEGTAKCGTVNKFTTLVTREGNDILFHIGGTLTTAKLTELSDSFLNCEGKVTATIVINDDTLSNID